ncbi:glycosyltransferase [Nocardioides sp. HDW12B]|uniref:glycosyltransferase n=1 Tax=Nocardioides sp. HDW12B TaxID=2714939 RepID=UPI001407DCA1|nr:glycosyltransferase [Nocardioides sp. HDW12B]QIK65372.1 glycosyltransferase [Nocardioides sp. HDW12B]
MTPLLTVVTVVFNDPVGLRRTLASVRPHLDLAEHWVIDGSTTDDVRQVVAAEADPRVHLLSEPDDGLYDAMNKGLDRATGDFVMFLNAGDVYLPTFDPSTFLRGTEVVVGHVVERFGDDRYLRPARNRTDGVLAAAPHPATAYPRRAYTVLRYDLSIAVASDGNFTRRAIDLVGGRFVPQVVTEFELGGTSSQYGDLAVVRQRVRETRRPRGKAQLVAKTVLWFVLPQRAFYRLLAVRKYDRITGPVDADSP